MRHDIEGLWPHGYRFNWAVSLSRATSSCFGSAGRFHQDYVEQRRRAVSVCQAPGARALHLAAGHQRGGASTGHACDHQQVLRPPAAISAEHDLCARGHRAETLNLGLLGGGLLASALPLVAEQARYVKSADDTPTAVLSTDKGQTSTGPLRTYVRDDLPAASLTGTGCVLCLQHRLQGRAPAGASGGHQGLAADRCLCRLQHAI